MDRGYVKLWRKTLDSGIISNGPAWQLFGYLLMNACHTERKQVVRGAVFDLKAGDVIFSRSMAAAKLELGEQQIRTALNLLKKLEIVTSRSTNKITIISFIKWNTYNNQQPADNQQVNQPPNQHLTSSQPANEAASSIYTRIKELKNNINTPPLPPTGGSESADPETPAEEAKGPEQDQAQKLPPRTRKRRQTQYSAAFEVFWARYPRKTGKDAAWKAWQRRSHELPGPDELAAILERQCHCEQWQRDGGQYIPHPATWLNQGRWKDGAETEQWTPKPANW